MIDQEERNQAMADKRRYLLRLYQALVLVEERNEYSPVIDLLGRDLPDTITFLKIALEPRVMDEWDLDDDSPTPFNDQIMTEAELVYQWDEWDGDVTP